MISVRNTSFRTLVVMLLLAITLPLTTQIVRAAEDADSGTSESITLSPATSQPKLTPGKSTQGELTVINNGTKDYTFITYARPFSVQGENYDTDFETVTDRTELYQWVKFPKAEYVLAAGESVDVPYSIAVPQNVRPGGHYAVLFAETQPDKNATQNVARKKRVGSLVYATAAGETELSGQIQSFTSKLWFWNPPVQSEMLIQNTGNTHFEAKQDIVYKNLLGGQVYGTGQTRFVMPGTTRKIVAEWEKPPLFGVFKLEGTVSYLGKTEALKSSYIIIMPLKVLIPALSVVLLTILWLMRKRRSSRSTQKSSKSYRR